MKNEERLIYANELNARLNGIIENRKKAGLQYQVLKVAYIAVADCDTVDAIEVTRIEEVKQEILQTLDTLIATHRDISNSPLANSAKYLEIPESSNDYYGIYAQAMEVARRLVNAALTDLCDKNGWRE